MTLSLHPACCSGAVFQAEKKVRVFGDGEGEITVSVCEVQVKTVAQNGKWVAELPPMPYGGPYDMMVTNGTDILTLNDVWFGDVFLLAGQSNMQVKMWEKPPENGYQDSAFVRMFSTRTLRGYDDGERSFPEDGWVELSKERAPRWSAIGYYFALKYHERTGRMVGLMTCYQGASTIESWLSEEALAKTGFEPPKDRSGDDFAFFRETHKLYYHTFKQVVPYTFSHILWYQGEANTKVNEGYDIYDTLLNALVESWRKELLDETLPFIIVQIADYIGGHPVYWPQVQAAQLRAQEWIPHVKTVISRDVCESECIHPYTKEILAYRLVEAALTFKG